MNLIFGGGLVVALAFLSAGCATPYRAPQPVDPNNPGIEAVAPVWIVRIDGQSVSRVGFSGHKQFPISAGKHLLELQYASSERREYQNQYGERRSGIVSLTSRKHVMVPFVAATGHHYYVHAGVVLNVWKPYINETPPHAFSDLPIH